MTERLAALTLEPKFVEKVWGGHALQPDRPEAIGESWVVFEGNAVKGGRYHGQTLGEVAKREGASLLGRAVSGERFPLLVKLIDASDNLSVQVHPDDKLAAKLEGQGQLGKTEAWHILDAKPGAELICGFQDGVTAEQWKDAMGGSRVRSLLRSFPVKPGDTLFIPAGTVHAIGAGLFIYEVQQTSDITYRVWDWDRPMKPGRELHVSQSVECSNLSLNSVPVPAPASGNGTVSQCEYFKLDVLSSKGDGALSLDTKGESFHALTVLEGEVTVTGEGWSTTLGRHGTVVVPASAGAYRLEPKGAFRALKSSVV